MIFLYSMLSTSEDEKMREYLVHVCSLIVDANSEEEAERIAKHRLQTEAVIEMVVDITEEN